MDEMLSRWGRSPYGPLSLALGYYSVAAISLSLTSGTHGIATVWPSSGLLLAVLLIVPRALLARYACAAALASMLANLGAGASFQLAAGFTAANIIEGMTAALLLRRRGAGRLSFVDHTGLLRFCLATLAAACASAMLATLANPGSALRFFSSWFTTVWLGMLIVAPLLLTATELAFPRRRAAVAHRPGDFVLVITLVAGISIVAFFPTRLPLLFLPMMALLYAVLRCGVLGAVVSVLVIAISGSIALSMELGPAALPGLSFDAQVLFFQVYLLALFASSLPMASLLAARDRLRIDLDERVRLLSQAERAAHIGHWRVDPEGGAVYWSPEVFRIHGIEGLPMLCVERALEAYHPDDRARVSAAVGQAMADGLPFEFAARLVRPDGTVRHVISSGERDFSSKDGAIGLFGLLRDVTEQVEAQRVLTEARDSAERAERHALIMAQTDALTGLPNRRHIMNQLADTLHAARRGHAPLSVAIFDIDHFKQINDRHGHAIGDEVLCRVAHAAARALRLTDMVGRYGGEEFVLILPDASPEVAMAIAERVRRAVEVYCAQEGPPVTISIGLATFHGDASEDALLRRADLALYAAKEGGRNQLRLAA